MVEPSEGESKRPRLEETQNQDNDNTSNYDLSDYEDIECDEAPFTSVTYKKKRSEGIPVVFRPSEEGHTFWQVNPNRVSSEIVSAAKEKVQSFRVNGDGSFSVSVASVASAKNLLLLQEVAGLQVKPYIPASYTRNVGKIHHVPLQYTEGQLLEFLKDFGVISVRRQARYYRLEDGTVKSRSLYSVILHFRDDKPMPQRIHLGFTSHPVEEYLGPALRCYNCQRFGHLAKNCRGSRRCKICSENHEHTECKSVRQPKCANSAFVIPEWNRIQTFKLSHTTSSTTAELFAILSVLRYINSTQEGNQWVILCDSQAALSSLHGGISNSQNMALVYETLKELTKASEKSRTILFQWIPGHCNIPGNVAADMAARQAHINTDTHGLPLTQGELQHILRQISVRGCKATWFDQNSKSSDLFHIDPALQFKIPSTLNTTRAFETLIHRLRLGTAYTKHFLQKISRADSPECTCGHADEDVQHLLLECPRHDTHRQRLARYLETLDRRPFSLRKILGPWPTYSLQRRALMALQRFIEASNILGNY
ncbi:uncharacterized protein LOC125944157 [Dermacentor silvarum]|nr:uncharacterized protein LOC125944157 [Dermacentor silvarum]